MRFKTTGSNNQKKNFQENGYILIKAAIKKSLINNFKKSFFNILNNQGNFDLKNDFHSTELLKKLIILRKKDERKIHGLFRTTKLCSAFNNLFYNDELQKLAASFLNIDVNTLIISEFQFRIDEPKDKLFTLDWHQDASYYNQDKGGFNSIVLNICVQDCCAEMGSPQLIKGSHKKGQIGMKKFFKKKSNTLQYNTNKKFIKTENLSVVEPKIGDVVIYDMNLVHRSGLNTSKKARFSVLARAFNPLVSTFRPFYFSKKLLV